MAAGTRKSFWVFFKGDIADLKAKMETVKAETEKTASAVKISMKQLGVGMTAAGAAITGAFGMAVNEASAFNSAMAEVGTLGVKDMNALKQGVRDIAKVYGTDLANTAKGIYDIISATGLQGDEAIKVLERSTVAAKTGITDVQTAANLGTNVLNAFGKDVGQVGSVFDEAFTAVRLGKTTMGELAGSVGRLAPTFAAAGLESREMMAALASVTLAGISTDEAATSLKAAMSNIIKPTTDAAKMAQKLGIDFSATALKTQGLKGFLDGISGSMAGMSDGQRIEAMSKLFGSVEALNSMLALTGNQSDEFAAAMDAMGKATGALDAGFKEFKKGNPAQTWAELVAQFKDLRIEIADKVTPALSWLMEHALKPMIKFIGDLFEAHPKMMGALTMITAALGALMVVVGPILIALPAISAGLGAVTAAGAVATAWAAGFIAVGVGVVQMFYNWNDGAHNFIEYIAGAFPGAQFVLDKLFDGIYWAADKAWWALKKVWDLLVQIKDLGVGVLGSVGGAVKDFGGMAIDAGSSVIGSIGNAVGLSSAPERVQSGGGLMGAMIRQSGGAVSGAIGKSVTSQVTHNAPMSVTFSGDMIVRNDSDINRITDGVIRKIEGLSLRRGIRI